MNWLKLLNRIPERVRIGLGGIALGCAFLSAPTVLAWWLRFWS